MSALWEEEAEEHYPTGIPMMVKIAAFGSLFFSLLAFFLARSARAVSSSLAGREAMAQIAGIFRGLWPLPGLLTALSATLLVLVLVRLVASIQPGPRRVRSVRLRAPLAILWASLWAILYIYLWELAWDHALYIRLDVFLGLGAIILILQGMVVAYTVLLCRRQGRPFLPRGVWARRYLVLAVAVFVAAGVLLPQAFPTVPSVQPDGLGLSDLLTSSTHCLAFHWAQFRCGQLLPRVLRLDVNPAGNVRRLLLSFASPKGRAVAFVYEPAGFAGGTLISSSLPLVIYPKPQRVVVPDFGEEDFAHALAGLDKKGIVQLVEESLDEYQAITGEPGEWDHCLLSIGTIYVSSLDSPVQPNLNISLEVFRSITKGGTKGTYHLFTAYISPKNMSTTGLREEQGIPASWVP